MGSGIGTDGGAPAATTSGAGDGSTSSLATAGSDGAESGADDGSGDWDDVPNEPCDGFDNNQDGQVDEHCACTPDDVQECYAGPERLAVDCRGTTQTCLDVGSEQPGIWGRCDGLCDGATLTLDDVTTLRIDGAAPGDRFTLASAAGFGDADGDGERDFMGASSYGDAAAVDVGAGYLFFGGPCLQQSAIDLAGSDGVVTIDDASAGGNVPAASLGDVDGDGLADAIVVDSPSTAGLVYGDAMLDATYDVDQADGSTMTRLTGGGGTGGNDGRGHHAADFDGDGRLDVLMSAENYGNPTCPCGSQGVDIWWGRDDHPQSVPLDTTIPIGIGTVGQASQHNFSVVGGSGDFNNDGFADLTGGNGAANDTMVINYRAFAFFGNAERLLPPSMTGVTGEDGFALTGGVGRGPFPNHQHGDFNGDGVDDFIAYSRVPYAAGSELYAVFGGQAFAASFTADELVPGVGARLIGTTISTGTHMGIGDVDADGYDDFALPLDDAEMGGVVIVWGREFGGGVLDVDADAQVTTIAGAIGLGRTDYIAGFSCLDGIAKRFRQNRVCSNGLVARL
ncbi:MAG: hypothetical protein AAF721_08385 [Myxococcota bacterium]